MHDARFYRIGIDIGGTFTDLVALDIDSGRLINEKVLTTPDDPSEAVLDGLARMLNRHHIPAENVLNVIHGTTLVANALIERKGVKTALVTTRGFRDLLEIGRELRYDIFDLFIELPEPLILRENRFELSERIDASGNVLLPLDREEAIGLAQWLAQSDLDAVAVVFLHAFRNPAHEQKVKEIFTQYANRIEICLSSEVSPEIREYERTSTTVANAYVQPIFRRYVQKLVSGLKHQKVKSDLYLMLSDGGTVHESAAVQFPIRFIQSGPAAGAKAASFYGKLTENRDILCFDMGGTTAKACFIEDGLPSRSTNFEVARVYRFAKGSGLPILVPVIDMIEVGAGGGSIARIDEMGLLQVGPGSAGSSPGPACYDLGGELPTVTDADLLLGYLDSDAFLGGKMVLNVKAAQTAVKQHIADPLGLSLVEAAWGIHETVNENMAQATTIHAIEKGLKISRFAMIPIGGAGPVHACHLARKMGLNRLVCPLGAGVASAMGLLSSPTSFEFSRAEMRKLDAIDFSALFKSLLELAENGISLLAASGVDRAQTFTQVSAFMRYAGQGHEFEVPLFIEALKNADRSRIIDQYETVYRDLFGRTEKMSIEIVSWRVKVSSSEPRINVETGGLQEYPFDLANRKVRPVFFAETQGFIDTPVFDRTLMCTEAHIQGPAIIEEKESTLVLPPSSTAVIDRFGNLMVTLDQQGDRVST